MKIKKYLSNKYLLPFAAVFSILALAFALFSQYFMGLEPCSLCIKQRYFHLIVILLCGLLFLNGWYFKKPKMTCLFIAFAFLASAMVAGYHSGLEYGLWKSNMGCTSSENYNGSGDDLLTSISNQYEGPRCDEIPWSIFGISMALYNSIFSFLMFLLSLICVFTSPKVELAERNENKSKNEKK